MSTTLYTFTINTITGEFKRGVDKDLDGHYDGFTEDEIGFATYNDDCFENVYAESLVSAERAEDLVYEKCLELREKFSRCVDNILYQGITF